MAFDHRLGADKRFFLRFCVLAQEGTCVTSEKNEFAARKIANLDSRKIANLNLLRKNAAPQI
jgi:hypothetical protein